ncbi:MAG: nucleotidyltransferase domain-containing protein [Candidatus Gastranaerophilales bacterium]|nr:nucleotidyltransferase domain-containing protein [Candidatus Gastranaerophilales bacterium]
MNNKLKKLLEYLKQELSGLYQKNLVSIILYGSQARSDSVHGSDIDILIVLNNEIKPIEEIRKVNNILSDISLKFNQMVSCVFMSQKRFDSEKSPLILNIKKEGILL